VWSHARFLVEELTAHYVMIVKGNQKNLFDRLDALDWTGVPVAHRSVDTGHGRHETRTIQVQDAPADLDFPHAAQVFLLERDTLRTLRRRAENSTDHKNRKGGKTRKNGRRYTTVTVHTAVAVLGVTSLSSREAAPEHLAAYVRGHWAIEVRHEVALCE